MPRFSATLLVPLLFLSINAFPQQRTLEISGLRNYTENELFEILNLNRYEEGTMTAKEVADTIITFYSEKGFSLVKVYVIENSETVLKIYVDEGALGKIIFLNMDDFSTIYLKIVFWFKNKIFNVNTVNENIEKLKKGKRWKEITYQLKPVKEYDTSIFQLDRALDLPLIGKKQLPFFDTYSPRFDLLVIFSKSDIPDSIIDTTDSKGGSGPKDRKKGKKLVFNKFNYGLKGPFYKGLIPYLKYYQLGLISNRDFFMGETSVGIMYGIDRKFKRPPRETYFHLNLNYFFTPTFKDIFTPLIRADLYQSQSARPDLGLLEYNFLILNTMLEPGITF